MNKDMPMEKEKYEEILIQLNSPDLEHSVKTDLLQQLRTDYNNVHTEFAETTKANEKLQKDNTELVISNSQLFRTAGIIGNDKKEEEVKELEFSETVTIEQLEQNAQA